MPWTSPHWPLQNPLGRSRTWPITKHWGLPSATIGFLQRRRLFSSWNICRGFFRGCLKSHRNNWYTWWASSGPIPSPGIRVTVCLPPYCAGGGCKKNFFARSAFSSCHPAVHTLKNKTAWKKAKLQAEQHKLLLVHCHGQPYSLWTAVVVDGRIQNRGETTGMLMGQKKKRGERHTNITETNQCSGYEKTNERWNIGGCESCNRTFQSEEGRKVNINGEV